MQAYQVIIIGSGFGGQCAAISLLRRGITDFRILERRDFAGGTWCQNSYPGAAVDVQSPLYSIASEPWPWTQMFAEQAELENYTHAVLQKYDLQSRMTLNANVEEVSWQNERQRWHIRTVAAGEFEAQFVINASGPLSKPVVPAFTGRETFQGHTFHTNGWDHSYDYRGKRVAIVGSGASAAQVIPAIAPDVAHLHVFQRTPHWVLPRHDRQFSALEQKLLKNHGVYNALRWSIYWKLETRVVGFKYWPWGLQQFAQRPAERHLAEQVSDPELRQKLTPDFTIGCKRIILSNTLYPALCRPNVTVHDKHDAIQSINPAGILTQQGQQADVDLIVWATGYDATDGVISYPVTGKGGTSLAKLWEEYPRAYLGTAVPGFPNFFVITGPNTGIGHTSALFVIESQLKYIMNSLEWVLRGGAQSIEVLPSAEEEYTAMIHSEMQRTVWKSGGCRSWYQSRSGHVIAMFPGFSFTFRRLTSRFREEHHSMVRGDAGSVGRG
jgi:cation diffusion facilitator CzcD-associated flavoprotein CzcO